MWLLLTTAYALDDCTWTPRLLDTPLASPTDAQWSKGRVLVVRKAARRVQVFENQLAVTDAEGNPACWQVALGWDYPEGAKQRQGDRKTPEGWYTTSDRPWSAYYGAITIHYPSVEDAERGVKQALITTAERDSIVRAHARGVLPPMETRLGGRILFHGGGSTTDWTLGCVALEDTEIDAMRALLPKSMRTHVLILP